MPRFFRHYDADAADTRAATRACRATIAYATPVDAGSERDGAHASRRVIIMIFSPLRNALLLR